MQTKDTSVSFPYLRQFLGSFSVLEILKTPPAMLQSELNVFKKPPGMPFLYLRYCSEFLTTSKALQMAPQVPLPEPKAKEWYFCFDFSVVLWRKEPFEFLRDKKRLLTLLPASQKDDFSGESWNPGTTKHRRGKASQKFRVPPAGDAVSNWIFRISRLVPGARPFWALASFRPWPSFWPPGGRTGNCRQARWRTSRGT